MSRASGAQREMSQPRTSAGGLIRHGRARRAASARGRAQPRSLAAFRRGRGDGERAICAHRGPGWGGSARRTGAVIAASYIRVAWQGSHVAASPAAQRARRGSLVDLAGRECCGIGTESPAHGLPPLLSL
eukprot:scaffold2668_cov319-Prasinococcus_capsulatus_cf.AAC.11